MPPGPPMPPGMLPPPPWLRRAGGRPPTRRGKARLPRRLRNTAEPSSVLCARKVDVLLAELEELAEVPGSWTQRWTRLPSRGRQPRDGDGAVLVEVDLLDTAHVEYLRGNDGEEGKRREGDSSAKATRGKVESQESCHRGEIEGGGLRRRSRNRNVQIARDNRDEAFDRARGDGAARRPSASESAGADRRASYWQRIRG